MDILTRCGLLQERAQLLLRSLLRSVSVVAVGGQAGPLVGHLLVGRLALPVRRRAPAEVEGPPPAITATCAPPVSVPPAPIARSPTKLTSTKQIFYLNASQFIWYAC